MSAGARAAAGPRAGSTPRPRVSPLRGGEALVLASWAALFWFLLATGRTDLYLSERTAWVVPLGAVILSVALAGRLTTLRGAGPGTLSATRAGGLALITLPVVIVLALPPASLGSFAASRRSAVSGAVVASSPSDLSAGELGLVDIATALRSSAAMRSLARRAGTEVSLVGFVTKKPGGQADELELNRFLISCCAADALSVQVRVVGAPPGRFQPDDWVRVSGSLYPVGGEVIVDASMVEPIDEPDEPYLNP